MGKFAVIGTEATWGNRVMSIGTVVTLCNVPYTYPLSKIEEAYDLFENHRDGVMKIAVIT